MLFERALLARGLPRPNVIVETSDLAVLRGILMNGDFLTAVSPRPIAYELDAGLSVAEKSAIICRWPDAGLADPLQTERSRSPRLGECELSTHSSRPFNLKSILPNGRNRVVDLF